MNIVDEFLRELKKYPVFARSIHNNRKNNLAQFDSIATFVLSWAKSYLGDDYLQVLFDGYNKFTLEVNLAQHKYEERGRYEFSTYDEVASNTYQSEKFMSSYHWGVLMTTFAWEHHLGICQMMNADFLRFASGGLGREPAILDLGCGSGIWHQLLRKAPPFRGASVTAVDISPHTMELSKKSAKAAGIDSDVSYICADALQYNSQRNAKFDIGISCFLLEHLESPQDLLCNLYNNLSNDSYAFVTCAITAAEIDHIYEFKKESEPFVMAEKAGFRVLKTTSFSAHENANNPMFTPRSFVMILRKYES